MKDYLFKGNLDEAFRLMENDLEGMQTMNQAIYQLLNAQEINVKEAWAASPDPNTLERMVRTGNVDSKSSAREWMM
jgi:Tfp pilus assembly ATPase PilU